MESLLPPGRVGVLTAARDDEAAASLWAAATDVRREATGLNRILEHGVSVLHRPGAFAVGLFDGDELVAMAVAMPALEDNARSTRVMPGMMHISSVATTPARWGQGLGGHVVRAVLAQGTRRGYARAQLWTHAANLISRRLYERLGFVLSGRTMVDDFAEPIVHYVRELTAEPMPPRPAARLLCFDPADRVLLIHWRDPFDGQELWEPPGGGIEAGETSRETALREWREETGLPEPELVGGPVPVARDLLWLGERYVGDEDFYLGHLGEASDPDVSGHTEIEQTSYLGHRWIPWQQIPELDGADKPDTLAVLRRLAPDGPWASGD